MKKHCIIAFRRKGFFVLLALSVFLLPLLSFSGPRLVPSKPEKKHMQYPPPIPKHPVLAPGSGGLIGRVTDKKTGESLPGAQITLPVTKISAFTDLDGIYEMNDLQPGAYTAQAAMVGYKTLEIKKVRIRPDKRTYLYFKLKPGPEPKSQVKVN